MSNDNACILGALALTTRQVFEGHKEEQPIKKASKNPIHMTDGINYYYCGKHESRSSLVVNRATSYTHLVELAGSNVHLRNMVGICVVVV